LPEQKRLEKYVEMKEVMALYKRNRYTMKMQELLRNFLE